MRILGGFLLFVAWFLFTIAILGDPMPTRTPEGFQQQNKTMRQHVELCGIIGFNGVACLVFPSFRKWAR